MPGWYPDPGGAPGRYRYWDGQAWSTSTSAAPVGADPGGTGSTPDGEPPRRRGRRVGPWVALAVLVVVLAVVVTLVVRSTADRGTVDGPLPTTTVSGGNDSSPSASPTPAPSQTPTPSPTPSPTPAVPSAQPCPVGDPLARQDHPNDGRVHGGGLSIPAQPGWNAPGPQRSGFSWTYDLGETDVMVQPRVYVVYAVGALSVVDGFETPRVAAELSMQCTAASYFYRNLATRRDLSSRATTVDGHPAWTIRSELRVRSAGETFEGGVVELTVVDLGSPESLAFFWGCAAIGDQPWIDRLDRTAAQLRAD